MIKSGFAALILVTLALTGCRVQTVNGGYVGPSQPALQRGLNVEGPWLLVKGGQAGLTIDVRRTRGGVLVVTGKAEDFARRVRPGVFETADQKVYQFFSDIEGRYDNLKNGAFRRLVRP